MKLSAKQITTSAILLAICIISQFFKNLSVFITGPIINLCLVLAVFTVGLGCAVVLSVITPVTAYFITGSPLMSVIPEIIPLIMLGNIVLVLVVHYWMVPAVSGKQKFLNGKSVLAAAIASIAKGIFMGLTISLWVIPTFLPQASPLRAKLSVFQMTFSVFQFLTAVIGFVYFFIVWIPIRKSQEK